MKTEPQWVEHDGSAVCPVPAGHDVEVRFRDAGTFRDDCPEGWAWDETDGSHTITHYRDWTAFAQQQRAATHAPKPEPRLLTEGEWAAIWNEHYTTQSFAEWVAPYRERGLIAAEPVDPLLVEARELLAQHYDKIGSRDYAIRIRGGEEDAHTEDIGEEIGVIFAALKRGMDLARATTASDEGEG